MKTASLVLLTVCMLVSALAQGQISILSTDFQSGIPANYSIVNNDGFQPNAQVADFSDAWNHVQDPEDALNFVAGSTSYFTPTGLASRWLITPQLELGTFGNSISWNAKSHDASFPDDYLVLVSITDTELESFTDTIGYIQEEYAEWTTRTVNLSTKGYDGLSIYIAFVNVTNDGFKLYLDDIEAWKEDPLSINEQVNVQVNAFPNPFTNKVTVSCDCVVKKMYLVNFSGQEIQQVDSSTLLTEELSSGVYFLRIDTDKGVYTQKIIKN